MAAATFTAIMAGLQIGGAMGQAGLAEAEGGYRKQQLEFNKKLADLNAEDSIIRGDETAAKYQAVVRKTKGTQRASFAAQGIDIDVGSAQDIQDETSRIGMEDVTTIKNNAWREAFGFKQEAAGYQTDANFAELSGKNRAASTLLTGGINAIGSVAGYFNSDKYTSKKGAKSNA